MQLKDSVFLVTGGASGLGAATARMAVDNGAKVVIADIQDGSAYAKELGANARYIKTDVTAEADGRSAVELAVKEFGGLNVLVNCAGIAIAEKTIGKNGPHALASFTRTIMINLVGSFNMIRLAAEAMAKGKPTPPASAASSSIPHRWPLMTARSGRRLIRPPKAASSP